MRKQESSTRDAILRATGRVVAEEGVSGLTLDAVAREAGVSKGGLLYHFPSKDALIRGMIRRLIEGFTGVIEREEGGPGGGRWVRAYARASFVEDRQLLDVSAGLLAAVANDPSLLDPLRSSYEGWQRRAERDGIDPAVATLVRLAADGLFFAEVFGFAPPEGRLRERVLETLLRLTKESRK
jgi:AcrR family transcriptional regulator